MPLSQQRKESGLSLNNSGVICLNAALAIKERISIQKGSSETYSSQCRSRSKGKNQRKRLASRKTRMCLNAALAAKKRISVILRKCWANRVRLNAALAAKERIRLWRPRARFGMEKSQYRSCSNGQNLWTYGINYNAPAS